MDVLEFHEVLLHHREDQESSTLIFIPGIIETVVLPSIDTLCSQHVSQQFLARAKLQHNNTNTSSLPLIGQVLLVYSTVNRSSTVIIQVIVQLAITSSEFELFEEQRVVGQGEGVKDIKVGL